MIGRRRRRRALLVAAGLASIAGAAATLPLAALPGNGAAAQPLPAGRVLRVGVFPAPPFAMKTGQGAWEGIAVELWQAVARDLGADYRIQDVEPEAGIAALAGGVIDAIVSPVAVTPEREAVVDFAHMFYTSGLGIAVPHRPEGVRWRAMFAALASSGFAALLLGLVALLVVSGVITWLVERRRNPEHFGGGVLSGIGAGMWWSAVTFTAVGYGDKVPVTLAGRVLAIVWMLTSVVLVSLFTGFVTAHVTLSHFERIRSREDLTRFRIAVVRGSSGEGYVRHERLQARTFDRLADALDALARQEIDGLVYADAALRYEARRRFPGRVDVLGDVFDREYYAFALPADSALREPINRALLRVMSQPGWRDIQRRYLGS